MEAPSHAELAQVQAVSGSTAGDVLVHWQSSFGLITIEVRQGQVYVNGSLVQLAGDAAAGANVAS
ncbi:MULTISPECIES: hypothetical protein [Ramlibacter]|uniref:Uncharacterized protein n=1 Tax=Ramlibacter aquaticus TaxID=2780094 RepID=A0ABR9SCM7_9BURK|nr:MULTISPECIES: hypothetical protein [Ramlibacter]MBE7940101.1 hypothetical protein [Ramlibacter aquaticus]